MQCEHTSIGRSKSSNTITVFSKSIGHRGSPAAACCTASGRFAPLDAHFFAAVVVFAPLWSLAVGVGHDEDAIAPVRGADGGCRYAVPLRVVPALGQASEYSSEAQGKVAWDVLQ